MVQRSPNRSSGEDVSIANKLHMRRVLDFSTTIGCEALRELRHGELEVPKVPQRVTNLGREVIPTHYGRRVMSKGPS